MHPDNRLAYKLVGTHLFILCIGLLLCGHKNVNDVCSSSKKICSVVLFCDTNKYPDICLYHDTQTNLLRSKLKCRIYLNRISTLIWIKDNINKITAILLSICLFIHSQININLFIKTLEIWAKNWYWFKCLLLYFHVYYIN